MVEFQQAYTVPLFISCLEIHLLPEQARAYDAWNLSSVSYRQLLNLKRGFEATVRGEYS